MNDLDKVVQEYVRNIVKDELSNQQLNDFIENHLGELVGEYITEWLDGNMGDYLEGRITVTID